MLPKLKPREKEDGTYAKHSFRDDETAKRLTGDGSTNRGDSRSEEATGENTQPPVAFTRGEMVFIKEHGWSGVNNASGVAKVLKSRVDDDGDLLYDVKYIIGRTARGVLAEYVSRHKL